MFYVKNEEGLTIYANDGNIFKVYKDTPEYLKALGQLDNLVGLTVQLAANKHIAEGNFVIVDGTVFIKDVEIPDELPIVKLINVVKSKGLTDEEVESIKPFLENTLKNPYINAAEELYDYCKALDFEITDDGCFLAYKKVNNDFTSVHANKEGNHILHTIGTYVEETDIDTNRHNVCSKGLHFCSKEYLKSFGGSKTIVVKVNPKDVVAIPTDYNFSKGRCTKYYVVGELVNGSLVESATKEKLVTSKTTIQPRILKTYELYTQYKNIHDVSQRMNISPKTVQRNLQKYKKATKK
jgi:hypothetical protein